MTTPNFADNSGRPVLLDLFCCAGGAAVGYERAGFDVVGVDIRTQPRYPYRFIQADVMSLTPEWVSAFDAVHASPPCQAYSDLASRNPDRQYPELIEPTRRLLEQAERPYIIENVEGAPLRNYIKLCGTMFPGLRVLRHRLFAANVALLAPGKCKPHPICHTLDKRKRHYGKTDEWKNFVSVNGGGNCSVASARDAMGIEWMTKSELNEAIPPAYTEFVGKQLFAHVR